MREKASGRTWTWPLFGQVVGIWRSHDKDAIKAWDDRGAVGYLLDIDIWRSVQGELGRYRCIDHQGRMYQGTPYAAEPDPPEKTLIVVLQLLENTLRA